MAGKNEIKRVHGLPDDFILPDSYVTGTEILGQGVLYRPFKEIFKQIKAFISGDSSSKLETILCKLGYNELRIKAFMSKLDFANLPLVTERLEKLVAV